MPDEPQLPRRRSPLRPSRKRRTSGARRPVRDQQYEQAVRDLQDALERLEEMGESPYPVGDATAESVAAWGALGIMLRGESLVWNPTVSDAHPTGSWDRWPHDWAPEHPLGDTPWA
ncbi:hypothetical protein ACFC1B_06885 [Streptomyces xiamenensis]|uniref:hypothetical protein n=1 Tax=Streptomyces xiamenensis TaxID=408015 RepID=UPI0035DAFD63